MKKIIMSCVLMMGVFCGNAFAQNQQCMIKVTIDRASKTLAEFNYRMSGDYGSVVGSVLQTLALGESTMLEVPCMQNYEIFATPVTMRETDRASKRSELPELGRCVYRGGNVFVGDSGISVVYPQDFICKE